MADAGSQEVVESKGLLAIAPLPPIIPPEPSLGTDGQPSYATLLMQVEFLKKKYRISDDDLEWMIFSTKEGAYQYAQGNCDAAEDFYFKALYEMAMNIGDQKALEKASNDALNRMELWAARAKSTADYEVIQRTQELLWLEREKEVNALAKRLLSTFLPTNLTTLSTSELVNEVRLRGGCITVELATELKKNALLHWIVTHPSDIAKATFLFGEKKAYFENIESLDVLELRALVVSLPEKFELDNDGKKEAWKRRLISTCMSRVAQMNGEKVKGGWDPKLNARAMVMLPPPPPEQMRRNIYYYPTYDQCCVRLKKFHDKSILLEKKEKMLEQAFIEKEKSKKDYGIP